MVEYCSRLAESGQYKYDPNKNQKFAAISCRCLNEKKNQYEDNIKKCSHAEMLQDDKLFEYIFTIVNDPKENADATDSKIEAAKIYNEKIKYEEICNNDIYDIFINENSITNDPVYKISKSTCKIEYNLGEQKKIGKGLLVSLIIRDSENPIRGMITSNYIIDTNNLYNSKITLFCGEKKLRLDLIPQEHFCFSDPFIDITFIELKNPEYDGYDF